MNLRDALAVLSKSSPYAVTTSGEIKDPELKAIKDYLYVETDVEIAFKKKLDELNPGEILFLCGSSGDGKSEILTRNEKNYRNKVSFHLDATHSFHPDENAIVTLDNVFSEWKSHSHPLVVGINIGMLANYEREGNEIHREIRMAMRSFLNDGIEKVEGKYHFIDFERFPKFTFSGESISAPFLSSLVRQVVADDKKNKFREYFNREYDERPTSNSEKKKLISNYLILRDTGVQKAIIELVLNARLKRDQFITARMMLDFIYRILTGEKHIYDNIFEGGENEILQAIAEFDPITKRTRSLDQFVLNRTLGLPDDKFTTYREEAHQKFLIDSRGKANPTSIVRQLYLFRYTTFENKYANNFIKDFESAEESIYREAWHLHNDYDGSQDVRKKLKAFYDNTILPAISGYANRKAAYLSKDEFYLSSKGIYDFASEVDIGVSYQKIAREKLKEISHFNLHLTINDTPIHPIPVNMNLIQVFIAIVSGYRPNRFDKNSIVLLDEIVSHITEVANRSRSLLLFLNGNRLAKIKESDDELKVSGL
ncbi:DNA phosphorothioation-dependent restriction protein DptF [Litorivivens lipolytica]|uniref:DNA phosphorothioation-dependent restriction protein DptF n=1 Tax=Litorivivens lipolytica TaxID=1524264 RepID=A0A7W4Z6X6_9GAMM|nr:DNA phosphorothioation-dependent restriction protein DptF [Litorivivens lipolytica]MBB3047420.1 DNA phosphorothioation-dependent restriction protein DptF [Litorivivens lipolytica]